VSSSFAGRVRANAAFAVALFARQLSASFALRGAFWMSAALMLVNDLFFFSTWWILLHRFEHIGGWRLDDMMCLYSIGCLGFGTCVIVAGGIHDLSRRIDDGDLDSLLTQPKSLLLQALCSRTNPSGWGDVVAAAGLLALSGAVRWQTLPALLVAALCALVVAISVGIAAHSLAFWFGRTHTLSRALWEFTLTFSLYPPTLFGGGIRFVLFTLLPAGLAAYLPVDLLRNPSWQTLALALGGAALYAAFALWLFARGLRRYASGNRFTRS
jgi:ABC-2 type transport system permease protein